MSEDVGERMKELYKKALKPVPVKDHIKTVKRHTNAAEKAYAAIKDKSAETLHDGYEVLADALIAYKKAAKLPVSDDPEDRHYVVNEVKNLLEELKKHGQLKGDAADLETKFATGDFLEYVNIIIDREKRRDLTGRPRYEIDKMMKGLSLDERKALAKIHAEKSIAEYNEGDIASLATPGALEETLADFYSTTIANQVKKKEHKKEGHDN